MVDGSLSTGGKGRIPAGSTDSAEMFGRYYEQYLPGIYRFVYYRVGDKTISEDLTSEIFSKALAAFGKFDSGKAAFSTWVYSIARNALTDYYRRRARETRMRDVLDEDSPSRVETVEAGLSRVEEIQKLHRCLSKLEKREQDIVSLKFASGMTNREIAVVMDLTESNVGTILCRTIRKLRDDFIGW
jgi:RNA polymerase sigma-70 factor (ECF subfamily)